METSAIQSTLNRYFHASFAFFSIVLHLITPGLDTPWMTATGAAARLISSSRVRRARRTRYKIEGLGIEAKQTTSKARSPMSMTEMEMQAENIGRFLGRRIAHH